MNRFLVSVANVLGYDKNDVLILEGTTLLNSTLEHAVSNTDIRAGQGNKLQYIYYHSDDLTGNIEESQFSLSMLALANGSTITNGANIWEEETVALTSGAGSVLGTPLGLQTTPKYGWVTYGDVLSERVTFNTKAFTITDTTYSGNVCVRYYAYNAAARHMDINASCLPAHLRLVMRVGLFSNDAATNKVGEAIITIYDASITGAFTITMAADGVSTTPLAFRATATTNVAAGCNTATQVYGSIDEVLYDTHWYDNVVSLAVVGGDFILANLATKLLDVRAVTNDGTAAFVPPYEDLTFSATGAVSVVNTDGATKGTVTGATAGGAIKVLIADKTSVEVTTLVTIA
jgi:hypothetical protein